MDRSLQLAGLKNRKLKVPNYKMNCPTDAADSEGIIVSYLAK